MKNPVSYPWKWRSPLLMGIVNATPDSFSDGGRFFHVDAAVEQGLRLLEDGADILDIGGESTRPGAEPVSEAEELRRVIPVVEKLNKAIYDRISAGLQSPDISFPSQNPDSQGFPLLSVDTTKSRVAKEAIDAGAEMINDISALRFDPGMLDVLLETEAAICVMHMQGTPQTMQNHPHYCDDQATPEVLNFLRERIDFLVHAGIARDRIVVDPGIGFGKSIQHNIQLLRDIKDFQQLHQPVLVGHSRKRFLSAIDEDRDRATLTISGYLADHGVSILRVHDVAGNLAAITGLREKIELTVLRTKNDQGAS